MARVKIQIFCPRESADAIRLAIGEAGGGRIGNYSHCVSVTESIGYFKPELGARPSIGVVGEIARVEEAKIEFVCDETEVKRIIESVKRIHLYEEVAYDVIPLIELGL